MSRFQLSLSSIEFGAALARSYQLGIGIVGYEARASFCPLRFKGVVENALALRYLNKQVRSFRLNNDEMEAAGFQIFDLDSGNEAYTAEFIMREAIASSSRSEQMSIIVDISSMSRSTMAGIFAAIMSSERRRVEVVFTYAIAAYERPPTTYPPLVEFGAVSNVFGGAPRGADKFTALILGVGYEAGRAIAAYSQMEAEVAWVLLPVSDDERYNRAVTNANNELLALSEKINPLRYDVLDPILLYEKIRTLALGLRRNHRLVFIPSGPKICALVTFLVGIDLHPDVSIWRMSSGPLEPLFHRTPSGNGIALSVVFDAGPEGST